LSTFSLLISLAGKLNRFKEAEMFYQQAKASISPSETLPEFMHISMIAAAAKANNYSLGLSIFQQFFANTMNPHAICLFVDISVSMNRLEYALDVLSEFERRGGSVVSDWKLCEQCVVLAQAVVGTTNISSAIDSSVANTG
jgi:hypothetical protein